MLKKIFILLTFVLIAGLLFTGCRRSQGAFFTEPAEMEEGWTNPEFNMDDVVEIPDTFFLDMTALAPVSWTDHDGWSMNPYGEPAAVEPNPDGGYNFTFDTYNQRIIFLLDSSQRYKLWEATRIDVEIDGEAVTEPRRGVGFRYNIGHSEKGIDWNFTINIPEHPAPFDDILKATMVAKPMEPEVREELAVNFMIQVRGGNIRDRFEPYTVTIRSIKLTVHYD